MRILNLIHLQLSNYKVSIRLVKVLYNKVRGDVVIMKLNTNKRHAFIFRGIGTEYKRFLSLFDERQMEMLKSYCDIANTEIGMDLWNYLYHGATTKYDEMFNDWIAIYTIDNIVFNNYVDLQVRPEILLGYSMGLITAMTCGKSISYKSGLHMLLKIYEYPIKACREDEAMAVIVGMTCNDIEVIIRSYDLGDSVGIASENNEYCILLSGHISSVNKVMSVAEEEGAMKVKLIDSPYSFHFKYAKNGIDSYIDFVEGVQVTDSIFPILSSFDQKIMKSSEELREELIKNMYGRMWWRKSIEKTSEMGITSFIEVSVEDSITKFSKLIDVNNEFITYSKFLKAIARESKVEIINDVDGVESIG